MAKFGLKYPCFKPRGEAAGMVLGGLVSANYTPNRANAELYADNVLKESDYSLLSADVAMELDDLTDEKASGLFGQEMEDGVLLVKGEDAAPEGVLGYYMTVRRSGLNRYVARAYDRARAQSGNENAQTKGSNTAFQTTNVTFHAVPDEETGMVYRQKTFATEAEAIAWIQAQCGLTGENASLSALSLGTAALTPVFDPAVTEYTAATTNATNTVTATAEDEDAGVVITVNGSSIASGDAATWRTGANTVTVTVVNGAATMTYTIAVTKTGE